MVVFNVASAFEKNNRQGATNTKKNTFGVFAKEILRYSLRSLRRGGKTNIISVSPIYHILEKLSLILSTHLLHQIKIKSP